MDPVVAPSVSSYLVSFVPPTTKITRSPTSCFFIILQAVGDNLSIFEKRDGECASNYRPVSLTSAVQKVFDPLRKGKLV